MHYCFFLLVEEGEKMFRIGRLCNGYFLGRSMIYLPESLCYGCGALFIAIHLCNYIFEPPKGLKLDMYTERGEACMESQC